MLKINTVKEIKNLIQSQDFVVRDIVEGNAYNSLYFNLISDGELLKCYSESSEVIDYILFNK